MSPKLSLFIWLWKFVNSKCFKYFRPSFGSNVTNMFRSFSNPFLVLPVDDFTKSLRCVSSNGSITVSYQWRFNAKLFWTWRKLPFSIICLAIIRIAGRGKRSHSVGYAFGCSGLVSFTIFSFDFLEVISFPRATRFRGAGFIWCLQKPFQNTGNHRSHNSEN